MAVRQPLQHDFPASPSMNFGNASPATTVPMELTALVATGEKDEQATGEPQSVPGLEADRLSQPPRLIFI